jgi:UDP-N-acetylglucosamine diphosphorylase/glucosamine-1-phosphate N-acetyltransferase
LLINGSICPNSTLAEEIKNLKAGEALYKNSELLAAHVKEGEINSYNNNSFQSKESNSENLIHIKHSYDIFSSNAQAIEEDFDLITKGRKSAPIPAGNQVLNPERIFIEEGASVLFSILNASTGSIYIGKDAEVMEGSKIRGPFALCEHAGLKMDAKIYGATTVGPYCKVGGEVNNSVFFAYSNKGHDGFVGNAVIGEWCNLGADTNNSNLKNTYEEVKLWNYTSERFDKTGLTFCGLMMADHAKSGINTMFNTGTVVGVGSNIFGSGFPRNFVPDFSWGGASGFETFQIKKMFQVAEAMCKRRNVEFTETDKEIILHVFEQTRKFRFWEKPNNA